MLFSANIRAEVDYSNYGKAPETKPEYEAVPVEVPRGVPADVESQATVFAAKENALRECVAAVHRLADPIFDAKIRLCVSQVEAADRNMCTNGYGNLKERAANNYRECCSDGGPSDSTPAECAAEAVANIGDLGSGTATGRLEGENAIAPIPAVASCHLRGTCPKAPPGPGGGARPGGGADGTPEGTTDAAATTPKTEEQAQAEATADLNRLRPLSRDAVKCCNNPASCDTSGGVQSSGNASAGTGMNSCNQNGQLNSAATELNNRYYSICSGAYQGCTGTGDPMVQKYTELAKNCAGCEAQGVYDSTLTELSRLNSQCSSMASKANAYGAQASANAAGAGGADACKGTSEMAAQSAGDEGDAEKAKEETVAQSTSADCAKDPSSAACQQQQQQQAAAEATAASPSASAVAPGGGGKSLSDFNPMDLLDAGIKGLEGGKPSDPLQYNQVANNTGGGVPGGGANPANASGPAARKGPIGSKVDTDIMRGFVAGGAAQDPGGAMRAQSADDGSGYNQYGKMRGPASLNGGKNPYQGVDLKRYLPGGDLDPNMHLAGLSNGGKEINGQSADMWKIINAKFVERCRLGVLYSCDK